jgi:hypothetical protein
VTLRGAIIRHTRHGGGALHEAELRLQHFVELDLGDVGAAAGVCQWVSRGHSKREEKTNHSENQCNQLRALCPTQSREPLYTKR